MAHDRNVMEALIQAALHWHSADKRSLAKNKTPEERVAASEAEHFAKRRLRSAASEFLFNQAKEGDKA